MEGFANRFDGTMDLIKSSIRACLEPLNSFLSIFSNFWLGAALITAVFFLLLTAVILKTRKQFTSVIKNPKSIAVCAMLVAVNVILGFFTITFSSYLRVGFGFVTTPIAAAMFGPAAGCAVALMSDAASYIVKPTGAFLITYTMNTGIAGMIYGLMLCGRQIKFSRVFLTKLLIVAVVNIVLNSIALAPTAGSGIIGILPARIVKNVILLPIQSVVVYELLRLTNISLKITAKGREQ